MPRSILASPIADLERALDDVLPARQFEGAPPPALMMCARRWSEAVWDEAAAQGPLELDARTRERGRWLARRPIFICGVHRSGTTLVRDLLDSHPSLAVLPSEGTYFTNFHAQLTSRPSDARTIFVTEWIRRLANPINQPPYWVLGRSTASRSPYVEFARASIAWWDDLQRDSAVTISSFPLAAVALGYAQTVGAGDLSPNVIAWVEKTPTNEQYLDRLLKEYPDGRVVHVVRDPLAVLASRKRAEERATGAFGNLAAALRDLERSYSVAHVRGTGGNPNRYMVVRYEDLVGAREATVTTLATFLGIRPAPTLFEPTVGGRPSSRNSSFGNDGNGTMPGTAPADVLSVDEREAAGAIVGDAAAHFGYRVPSPGSWRTRYLRLKLRWNPRRHVSV